MDPEIYLPSESLEQRLSFLVSDILLDVNWQKYPDTKIDLETRDIEVTLDNKEIVTVSQAREPTNDPVNDPYIVRNLVQVKAKGKSNTASWYSTRMEIPESDFAYYYDIEMTLLSTKMKVEEQRG